MKTKKIILNHNLTQIEEKKKETVCIHMSR